MKEQRLEKVVEWRTYRNTPLFITTGIFGFIFLWVTSLFWVPFYLFYEIRREWKEDRKVYWRKIK